MIKNSKLLVFFCLILILAFASFFRLWQLDSIPPGLYPDEAINGNQAISEPGKIFYPENNGREGLFINLIFLSFSIFGISIWALKIVPAIIGILTILGLYLLTKELFNKNIALLSSFFLATSFWHVNFSRIAFRGILVPFILVFAFYFLFKAFKTKRVSDFIFSGIFWGAGFYTYISFRAAVLILAIILILKLIEYLKQVKLLNGWQTTTCPSFSPKAFKVYIQENWWKMDLFVLVIILVALPLGIYFFQNPGDFISRATEVSIFAQPNPIKAFGESLIRYLAMFNFYGDFNWRHNFAGSPMLLWPIGILFLIGFFLSIKNKNWLPLSWFFIMLLPGILTYEGIPHALRSIGVIPVVYIFAGLGGWEVYRCFDKNVKNKKLLLFAALLFLFTIGFLQFDKYFIKWSIHPETEGAFAKDYLEIGNYLNSLPPETPKYVIVNVPGVPVPYPDGIPMPAQTVMFIESTKFGSSQSTYLLPENINQIKTNDKKTAIIPMRYDKDLFSEFSQKFPQGKLQKENDIWIYKINL